MSIFDAIIYGIIQGLTEFLPVSSSGHLALLPHFLEIKDPGVAFDLSMHVGTALAVMAYFRDDLMELFKKNKRDFLFNQILATAVTVVFILILKPFTEKFGRDHVWICINLAFFGILMTIADILGAHGPNGTMHRQRQIKKSSLIGFFQALAIFPGVSRSGATLTIARFLSLSREEAGRFSFLLSLPIIMAGFVYKLPELGQGRSVDTLSLLIGMAVSFVVGYATIHYFLKVLNRVGLVVFGVYRILLALLIFFIY